MLLLAASAAAPAAHADTAPRIPLCEGMTLVTAVNSGSGDYESIKTIKSVTATQARINYSAEKMDYGDLFSTDPPRLKSYVSKRIQRLEDLRTSRAYLQQFDTELPEDVPGLTSLGTSSLVLSELKKQGHADLSIAYFWGFPVPPSLNREDPNSVYRRQLPGQAKVVSPKPETLSVLVNGVPTALPAIHVSGNFLGYVAELWFLDQADNPLTLKYRIGVDAIKPKTPEERKDCESQTKMLGYIPQQCLKPDGGDQSNLDLVKVSFTCAMAAAGLTLIIVGSACCSRCRMAFSHDRRDEGDAMPLMILTRCASVSRSTRLAPCANLNFSTIRLLPSRVSGASAPHSADR